MGSGAPPCAVPRRAVEAGAFSAVVVASDGSACLEQNASAFRAIRRWRCECADAWREAPLLDVGFNKHESGLAEVDVKATGSVGADGREQVPTAETSECVLSTTTVPSEKSGSGAWAVTNSKYIAFDQRRAARRDRERIIMAALAR